MLIDVLNFGSMDLQMETNPINAEGMEAWQKKNTMM
jgi:hypothetical protein